MHNQPPSVPDTEGPGVQSYTTLLCRRSKASLGSASKLIYIELCF